jgi:hypothetical protein
MGVGGVHVGIDERASTALLIIVRLYIAEYVIKKKITDQGLISLANIHQMLCILQLC